MKLRTTLGTCGAALTLALAGCGGSATGGDAPKTVEDKAAKLAADSSHAVVPVPGQSVEQTEWTKCSEETPGVHRFSYEYVLKLSVEKSGSQPVMDQEVAYWTKQGYTVQPTRSDNPTRQAYLPKDSDWSIGMGIDNDGLMFLTVSANCVHVSSDPKTG